MCARGQAKRVGVLPCAMLEDQEQDPASPWHTRVRCTRARERADITRIARAARCRLTARQVLSAPVHDPALRRKMGT